MSPTLILEIQDVDGQTFDTVMIEGTNPAHAFHFLEAKEAPFFVKLWRERYRGREFLGEIQRDCRGIWYIDGEEAQSGEA